MSYDLCVHKKNQNCSECNKKPETETVVIQVTLELWLATPENMRQEIETALRDPEMGYLSDLIVKVELVNPSIGAS